MHDLLIHGGTVIDGTGAPARALNVAIDNGLITAVGADVGSGREQIDASGLLVTPGWVDIHTHDCQSTGKMPGKLIRGPQAATRKKAAEGAGKHT